MPTVQSSTPLVRLLADRGLAADFSRWQELFWGVADFARQRASQASTAATWTPESLVLDANGSIQECSENSNPRPQLPEECGSAWRHPAWARQIQTGRGDEFYSLTYLLCVLLAARRPPPPSQARSPWLSEEDLRQPWRLFLLTDLRANLDDPLFHDPVLANLPARLCALREQRAEDMPTMAESSFFFESPTFSRLSTPALVSETPSILAPQALQVVATETDAIPVPVDVGSSLPIVLGKETPQVAKPVNGESDLVVSEARSSVPTPTASTTTSAVTPSSGDPSSNKQSSDKQSPGSGAAVSITTSAGASMSAGLGESTSAVESDDISWDVAPDALGLVAFGPTALTVDDRGWSWRSQLDAPVRTAPTTTPPPRVPLVTPSEHRPEHVTALLESRADQQSRHEAVRSPTAETSSVVDSEEENPARATVVPVEPRDSSTVVKSTEVKPVVGDQLATLTALKDAPADQLSLPQLIVLGRDEEARARFQIGELRERYALGVISAAELSVIRKWLRTHVGGLDATGLRAATPALAPDGPPKYRVSWEGPQAAICGRCCVMLTRDPPGSTSTPDEVQAVRSFVCSWNNGERNGFILSDDMMDCYLAIWPCLDIGDDVTTWVFGEPLVLERTVRELLPPRKPPPPPATGILDRLMRRLKG